MTKQIDRLVGGYEFDVDVDLERIHRGKYVCGLCGGSRVEYRSSVRDLPESIICRSHPPRDDSQPEKSKVYVEDMLIPDTNDDVIAGRLDDI